MRLAIAVALVVTIGTLAHARRDATIAGDVIKAARLLTTARLVEAHTVLTDLENRAPDAPEVKWLRAEFAFQSGDYAGALASLEHVRDDVFDGLAGGTRRLATSTLAVTKTFAEVTSPGGHFLIRYPPGPEAAIAELAGEVLDRVWQTVGEDLGLFPRDPIRVEILASPSDLAKLSPLSEAEIEATGTIALSKYNKVMVVSPRATLFGYAWMDTLAHEYTHLVVSRISHDTAPVWLQEGIARFEQTRWRRPPEIVLSATEQTLLSAALRKRRLIAFDDMHPSIAKLPSQEAAALAYAEVYTLLGWMQAKVGYKGIRDALVLQRDGRSARRAVSDAVGIPWSTLETQWRLQLRASDTRGRTSRLIKFKRHGVSSENVGLTAVSSRARRFARLGGMLRARGMLAAAAVEYEKALAISGSEPFVVGKLARTLVELGRYDRAIELAAPLAATDDGDAVAAQTLGMARSARQAWREAATAYEQALQISPFDPETRCGLAEAYDKIKDARAKRERAACQLLKDR